MLVNSVQRVKNAKSAGGPNKQIQQEERRFQANIGYGGMNDDYKSSYLESSTGGGRYGLRKFRVPKVCSERRVQRANLAEFKYRSINLVYAPSQVSRKYLLWCHIHQDPVIVDFWSRIFPSLSVKIFGRRNFGKLIVGAFEYCTCKRFYYLFVFLVF